MSFRICSCCCSFSCRIFSGCCSCGFVGSCASFITPNLTKRLEEMPYRSKKEIHSWNPILPLSRLVGGIEWVDQFIMMSFQILLMMNVKFKVRAERDLELDI